MLAVDSLNAFYGDSHVLHSVSVEVSTGSRVSVLGRNGAGKSTLLKSIIGDEVRAEGTVSWDGQALSRKDPFKRSRLGFSYVPEDRRVFPTMTVAENIIFANRACGREALSFSPEAMFEKFPMLKPLARRRGDQLSGGQQQMLAVARGLSVRPKLLLLDEPTEGLAPIIVDELLEAIVSQCKAERITLVLCEQNLSFARQCTDYVHVLSSGSVAFSGTWSEFDAREDIKLRYLSV